MNDADLTARICQRAYQIWENEGRPSGRQLSHWLQAELELSGSFTTQALKSSKTKKPPEGGAPVKNSAQSRPPSKRPPLSH